MYKEHATTTTHRSKLRINNAVFYLPLLQQKHIHIQEPNNVVFCMDSIYCVYLNARVTTANNTNIEYITPIRLIRNRITICL